MDADVRTRESVCEEILRTAQPHHTLVACSFFDGVPWENKDRALSTVGLCDDGHGWVELSREGARALSRAVLSTNIAYIHPVVAEDLVAPLVDSLFALLPATARFFTNHDPPFHAFARVSVGSSKTHDFLDTGVAIEDGGELIAVLWVADED